MPKRQRNNSKAAAKQAAKDETNKRRQEEKHDKVLLEEEDEEEQQLREELFGMSGETVVSKFDGAVRGAVASSIADTEDISFVVDTAPDGEDDEQDGAAEDDEEEVAQEAWVDDDDETVRVNLADVARLRKLRTEDELPQKKAMVSGAEYAKRLREQHQQIYKYPKWAQRGEKTPAGETPATTESVFERDAEAALREGIVSIERQKDVNAHGASDSVVQAVAWHKNAQLTLAAGMDKTLRLFKVDGEDNPKVQSVFLRDLPIMSASFVGHDHEEIICAGRRSFFYSIDLHTGRVARIPRLIGRPEKSLETMITSRDGTSLAFLGYDGTIMLASSKTKQWIGDVKMNGTARCAAFSSDGTYMWSSGGDGQVYKWDMRTRRCVHRHVDEGSLGARTLDVSADGKYYALGHESGVVNVYDSDVAEQSRSPVPMRVVMNLTTPIDQVVFSHDGHMLSLLSRRKQDALRLLHVPSGRVVSNWPTQRTPLHYASCASFSPHSGYLSIGNDKGKVLLYRVRNYAQA